MYTHGKILLQAVLITVLISTIVACRSIETPNNFSEPQGTITISGAWALYPMMTRWAEEYQHLHPAVKFDISAGGAGKGIADTLDGIVDLGMVSRNITSDEEQKGVFWVAVTKDAVLPLINEKNPVIDDLMQQGLTQATLAKIYLSGEIKTWGELVGRYEIKDEIHVYTRSDTAGASETWAKYLDSKQEDLLGVAVFGDPGVLEAVIKDPLGISYINLSYAYDFNTSEPAAGSLTLPIDINENGLADAEEILETKTKAIEMVALGKYPSPPARPLNLVTNGKPTGLVLEFLNWILNEGQLYVGEAGFVILSKEELVASIEKLH